MGMFQSRHKQTKKSYLVNAVVAFLLGIFMIICVIFEDVSTKDFLVGAGIMWVMGAYWVYKHIKFDDKDFNDPFHLRDHTRR